MLQFYVSASFVQLVNLSSFLLSLLIVFLFFRQYRKYMRQLSFEETLDKLCKE